MEDWSTEWAGLLFFDEDGNPLVQDDDAMDKATFGGDRSAAGRYAAQVRWGNRGNQAAENRDEDFLWMTMDAQMLQSNNEAASGVAESVRPVSGEEYDAVFRYSQEDNELINLWLRGVIKKPTANEHERDDLRVDETVKALDGMFERSAPLDRDVMIVRGVTFPAGLSAENSRVKPLLQLGNLQEGDSFKDGGFVSGSSLLRPMSDFDGPIRLEIVIPKGSKALPIHRLGSGFEEEAEWLLPRGKRFRVLSRDEDAYRPRSRPTQLRDVESVTLRVVMED